MSNRYDIWDYLLIYSQSLTMWSNLLIFSLYYKFQQSLTSFREFLRETFGEFYPELNT